MPALISGVVEGSIAEELEIQEGDILLSIDGEKPQDMIDYRFLSKTELMTLEIQKNNSHDGYKIIVRRFFVVVQGLGKFVPLGIGDSDVELPAFGECGLGHEGAYLFLNCCHIIIIGVCLLIISLQKIPAVSACGLRRRRIFLP